MPILIAFALIALMAAGLFAVTKGDTFVMATILVVLLLVILVVAPQVPTVLHYLQDTLNAHMPVALR